MGGGVSQLPDDVARKFQSVDQRLGKAIIDYLGTPEDALGFFLASSKRSGAGQDSDTFLTIPRVFGVTDNVHNNYLHDLLYPPADGSINPPSDDGPDLPFQHPLGGILLGVNIGVLITALARRAYQRYHERYRKGTRNYEKRLKEKAAVELDNIAKLDKKIQKRIAQFRSTPSPVAASQPEAKKEINLEEIFKNIDFAGIDSRSDKVIDAILDQIDMNALVEGEVYQSAADDKKLADRIKLIISAFQRKQTLERIAAKKEKIKTNSNYTSLLDETKEKKPVPNKFVQAVQYVDNSRVMYVLGKIWDWAKNFSYIYWLVWMPVVLLAGFALANGSGVVIATLAIGGFFAGWTLRNWYVQQTRDMKKNVPTKSDEQIELEDLQQKEDERQEHEAKLRDFVSEDHKSTMMQIMRMVNPKWKKLPKQKEAKQAETEEEKAARIRFHKDKYDELKKLLNKKEEELINEEREYKKILEDMIGSRAERVSRLVVTGVSSLIGTFVMSAFVIWLGTAFTAAFIVPLLAIGIAKFKEVTNSYAFAAGSAGAGGILGAILGVRDVINLHQKQRQYQHKVLSILSARYKDEDITVLEKYRQSRDAVQQKVARIKEQHPDWIVKNEEGHDTVKGLNFDLDIVDPEYNRYFEKLQTKMPLWTKIKKVLDYAYAFICDSQTGIFCSRNLFLAGTVGASIMCAIAAATGVGVFVPFIVGLVALAVVVGGLGVTKKYLEANQEERENKVGTILTRIKRFVKWEKELDVVKEHIEQPEQLKERADQEVEKVEQATRRQPANDGSVARLGALAPSRVSTGSEGELEPSATRRPTSVSEIVAFQ